MRNLSILLICLMTTGCIIWRPSGGGLLNPCGSHRCDARPASYKTTEPPALKEGKQYKLRDCGLLRVPTEQRATATYDRCWQCHTVKKKAGGQ